MAFAIRKPSSFTAKFLSHSRYKKERTYCTHCKITGHTLKICFKADNDEAPICSHCNFTGHTIEKCYKLNGYPPSHKLLTKSRSLNVLVVQSISIPVANVADISDTYIGLTKDQYNQLMDLLPPGASTTTQTSTQLHTSPTPHISGIHCYLNVHTHQKFSFHHIHMICCSSFFSIVTSTASYHVALPNGTHVPATHTGTIQLTPSICLKQVLCVPSFNFNLISVKKLMTNLTCSIIFFSNLHVIHNLCVIQDLLSWTSIGKGEIRNGLYHFVNTNVSPSLLVSYFSKNSIVASISHKSTTADLWHCRLRHPSSPVMSLIINPVSKQISVNNLAMFVP